MPQALVLTETRPASLKEVPPKLRAPLYGILPIGASGTAMGRIFHVIVDEPDGADAALYIDTNGDGDLTNDPRPVWKLPPCSRTVYCSESWIWARCRRLGV